LLIGINDYPSVPKLKGAVPDVNAMYNFLVGTLGVQEERVQVLRDADATHQRIISSIRTLASDDTINKGDPILIFYAGHGSTLPKPEKWSANSAEIQCLVAYDARID